MSYQFQVSGEEEQVCDHDGQGHPDERLHGHEGRRRREGRKVAAGLSLRVRRRGYPVGVLQGAHHHERRLPSRDEWIKFISQF